MKKSQSSTSLNKQKKTWKTPTIKELPITLEIAAYRCAELDEDRR